MCPSSQDCPQDPCPLCGTPISSLRLDGLCSGCAADRYLRARDAQTEATRGDYLTGAALGVYLLVILLLVVALARMAD